MLGAPKVEAFEKLTKACFLVAVVACCMRARRIPTVIRTDRGPEMTSAVMEEFATLVQCEAVLRSGLHTETPRSGGTEARFDYAAVADLDT